MITTIKIQTSKPLSGPKKFCLCSVVYTFLRPAVPELLTQLIKLFILLKHSLFYRLVIKQNLIANTWQHCFERQSVGLVRSIEILLNTQNICSLFSIRLKAELCREYWGPGQGAGGPRCWTPRAWGWGVRGRCTAGRDTSGSPPGRMTAARRPARAAPGRHSSLQSSLLSPPCRELLDRIFFLITLSICQWK